MSENNNDKLISAFIAALEVDASLVNEELKYQGIPEWDSITHMYLINEIENTFEKQIDSDDILEMNSFTNVKNVLLKYDITF